MLQPFAHCRVVGIGDYEIEGKKYPWVELTQFKPELPGEYPERESTGTSRYSVSLGKDVPLPTLGFGDVVEGFTESSDQSKVVKGTDRALSILQTRIVALAVVGSTSRRQPAAERQAEAA